MGLAYEIPFGSPKHDDISKKIYSRYQFSREKMSTRYAKWRRAEELHMAYVPTDEKEASKQEEQKAGEQVYAQVTIPYSYSMLLSAHTYWTTIFLSRDPVLQFMGRHGETEQKTQALESLMAYQTLVGKHLLPYYVWLYDVGKYGVGILGNYWTEEMSQVSEIQEVNDTYMGLPIIGKKKKQRVIRRLPGYEGEKLYNVRPFDFFPDPRVPLQLFQDGEFAGRLIATGWNKILKRKAQGLYFNIDFLERAAKGQLQVSEDGSSQIEMPIKQSTPLPSDPDAEHGFVDLLEMYVELVPQEWKLGTSQFPEKWVFTAADVGNAQMLIIGAQPYGEYHNKFPFSVLECEMDGYALLKRGYYDILEPLQSTMDWLFNSHFFNVRRALNDSIIYDPSRVNTSDFESEEPGNLVRLLPSAYGSDPRTAATQFAIHDVTQMNLTDAQGIGQMMQRTIGVNDGLMGMLANGAGRKTATEVRQANTLGINRLKTQAEYFSATGWSANAEMMVASTQQHYNKEMTIRIAGDLLSTSGNLAVTPEMISGFYDFVPVDGNMPIDRFAQVNLWTQLMGQMRQNPAILAEYDMGKIFSWVARLAGLKNINQFRVQPQVVPDEQVAAGVKAGNLQPVPPTPGGVPQPVAGGGTGTPDPELIAAIARGGL